MLNLFLTTQFIKILHAPICLYDKEGRMLQALEDVEGKKLIEQEEFKKEITLDFPYIQVARNGVAFCVMWAAEEEKFIGLGKLRIYDVMDEEAAKYPYCSKDEFAAIISIIWNMITGKEVGIGELWDKNVNIGIAMKEQIIKDIFDIQEEGRYHNPYAQELREKDSIRRGDMEALKKSINEVYSGQVGILANDPVRQYKNIAICVISGAARCAIEGGVNPELAFSISDSFIRNIEENMSEPLKIEKAAREAEYEFTELVHKSKEKNYDNPLVNQVQIQENFVAGEWNDIGTTVVELSGEYFLVTGSGKYFRNVIIHPEDSIGLIEIDETGTKYRIVWGFVNGGRPTSELPSHLMNHEVKKRKSDGKYRVIYHAHTTNIIALTFVLPLEDEVFTRELWEMATECPVVFPDGIGVVSWMVPGGREIAVATSKLMEEYDVAIWAHHGMFAAGEDFDSTFGLMHTVEKAAEILVKMRSICPQKRQTITAEEFRALAKDFGVTLPEKFLYEKESVDLGIGG